MVYVLSKKAFIICNFLKHVIHVTSRKGGKREKKERRNFSSSPHQAEELFSSQKAVRMSSQWERNKE